MGRLALVSSCNEARFFHLQQVLPEHLLLAIAGNPHCAAFRILRALDVDMVSVVREVFAASEFGPPRKTNHNPKLSVSVLRVLEVAAAEGQAHSVERIGTEHLLLGLLQVQSLASSVLKARLGIEIGDVRRLADERAKDCPQEET